MSIAVYYSQIVTVKSVNTAITKKKFPNSNSTWIENPQENRLGLMVASSLTVVNLFYFDDLFAKRGKMICIYNTRLKTRQNKKFLDTNCFLVE
jgi:hypothetical protein